MSQLTKKQTYSIILIILVSAFFIGTNISLYVPSLPNIAKYFHTERQFVELTVGAYLIGYGFSQIFWGILSDGIGRKKIMVLTMFTYAIVSFLSVFAHNVFLLVMFRFLQGIMIAGVSSSQKAILTDSFKDKKLAKTISIINMAWSMGPILGPIIGSYLQYEFGWQADFYFFGIVSSTIFLLAVIFIPETLTKKVPIDFKHVAIASKEIFSNMGFISAVLLAGLGFSIMAIFNVIAPFLIQDIMKFSVIAYGRIALVMGVAYFMGLITNRILIQRYALEKIVLKGLIGQIISATIMLVIAFLYVDKLWAIMIPIFFILFMFGFVFPTCMTRCLSLFPDNAGLAGSFFGSTFSIFGGITAIFAVFLKTDTQIPLAITYFSLLLISIFVFKKWFVKKDKGVSLDD